MTKDKRLVNKTWCPHFSSFTSKKSTLKYKARTTSNSGTNEIRQHLLRLNNPRFVNVVKPKLENRRVKSYLIYKFIRKNGVFTKYSKRVKLSEFKRWMNINKTNKVVGWTPDYVGSMPSLVTRAKNYITEAVSKCFTSIVSEVSIDMETDLIRSASNPRVVYSSGYDTVHSHIKEYFKDNTTDEVWTIDNIVKVLNYSNFAWFVVPHVNFGNVLELFSHVRVNLNAYAGHYTTKLFGQGKAKSDQASRIIAAKIWSALKYRPLKNMYLWTVLGREKDIKVEPNNKVPTEVGTRVVLTTENPMCTLLMWFAQKIGYVINNCSSPNRTFNVSGEFDANKYRKIHDREKDYDWKLEADWTYYDSNIDTNFLIVAGILMTMGLTENRLHRNIAYLIIKSIVTKYVLLPPGVVVELNRAQPSGHPFGTLTNCYVNTIYWCLIGYKIYGPNYARYMRIEVYGDDTYALFKDHDNLWNIDKYVREIGLNSEPLINNFESTHIKADLCNRIDFLKRRFDETGLCWNHKKVFDRLFYQSRNRDINDQILLLHSFLSTSPFDDDMVKLCSIVSNYLLVNHYDKIGVEEQELLTRMCEKRVDKDYRYCYFNPVPDELSNYNKFQKIYDWSTERLKVDVVSPKLIGDKLDGPTYVLLSLGFTYEELFSYRQQWNKFGGLSPPLFSNRTTSAIVHRYWVEFSTYANGFLTRLAKRKSA